MPLAILPLIRAGGITSEIITQASVASGRNIGIRALTSPGNGITGYGSMGGVFGRGSLGRFGFYAEKAGKITYSYEQQKRTLVTAYHILLKGSTKGGQGGHGSGLIGLANTFGNTVPKLTSTVKPTIEFDTSRFDKAMQQYARWTTKEAKDIVNKKAFSIALGAFNSTYAATKEKIRAEMDAPSYRDPEDLTVAEAIVLSKKQGLFGRDLKSEATALKNKRINAAKSLQRSWLKAIRGLSPYSQTRNGKAGRAFGTGYGIPEVKDNNPLATAVLASITKVVDFKANNYLKVGFQKAFDKEASSMEQYVANKVNKLNQKVNSL